MTHLVPAPLPQPSHLRVFDLDSIYGTLDDEVAALQQEYHPLMKEWEKHHGVTTVSLLKPPQGEIPGVEKGGKASGSSKPYHQTRDHESRAQRPHHQTPRQG